MICCYLLYYENITIKPSSYVLSEDLLEWGSTLRIINVPSEIILIYDQMFWGHLANS